MNNRKRRIKYKPKIAHWAADLCVNHTGKPAFFLLGLRAPLRLSAFSCSCSESLCSDRELLLSACLPLLLLAWWPPPGLAHGLLRHVRGLNTPR